MIIDVIFLTVLAVCFITDILQQKIYNIVVLPSILTVLFFHIYFSGLQGLKLSSLGFLTGLCILLIPYFLGGMGAGDVKLLAFIGAAKGTVFVLNTAIYMALIGGIISIAILIINKQIINFFKSIFSYIFSFVFGIRRKIELNNSGFSNKFPYGTAIVLGALVCLLFKEVWII